MAASRKTSARAHTAMTTGLACSRRALLKALLGLPLGAVACKPRTTPMPRISGRLLGTNATDGHRLLREAPRRFPAPTKVGTVIVGGGIAGLSAGWRLLRRGYRDFVLLELEGQLGGTSASGANDTTAFPWGAHYVCTPPPEFTSMVTLLDELGVIEARKADGSIVWSEEALCKAPQERVFYRGRWTAGLYLHEGASAQDLQQLESFEAAMATWAARRDQRGQRAFVLPVAQCSTDPEFTHLDKISMATYMAQQGWTSPRLLTWVDYACRDDYGLRLAQTSAWAGIFYFASRISEADGTPAEFLTWPEGNGRIVKHLHGVLDGRTRTNALVIDITPDERGVWVHLQDTATGEPAAFFAEHVICATPVCVAKWILSPWRAKARPAWLDQFAYTPWVVASLTLRSSPPSRGFPLAWDNVLYESNSLGYVDATHQMSRQPGRTVWSWYLPLCSDDPKAARRMLYLAEHAHWCDAVLSDLRRAHPAIDDCVENVDVWRWGHAMVRPTVGFVHGGAPQAARRSLGRVHFAHTDLSGLALFEEAHGHGVRAADAVLGG
jgi:protoporphyrinogen oxidase